MRSVNKQAKFQSNARRHGGCSWNQHFST